MAIAKQLTLCPMHVANPGLFTAICHAAVQKHSLPTL